jgi:hypothetical protein
MSRLFLSRNIEDGNGWAGGAAVGGAAGCHAVARRGVPARDEGARARTWRGAAEGAGSVESPSSLLSRGSGSGTAVTTTIITHVVARHTLKITAAMSLRFFIQGLARRPARTGGYPSADGSVRAQPTANIRGSRRT